MASKLTLGELVWKIKADSAEFQKGLTNSQKGMQALSKKATDVGKGLTVGLTLPLVALGGIAVKNAADFEKQRVAFGTLLKDVDKGNKLFEDLKKFSAETPLALGDITSASERLLAVGVGMESQVDVLRQLGDLALGDSLKLDRLTNAYTKLKTKGRASLEELNLFTDAGIPLMDTLAQTMGVTTQEVFKLVSAGKVGMPEVQKAMDALTGAGGTFNNAMKNASETTSGQFSTALDNAKIASAELGKVMLPTINKILLSITSLAKSFSGLDDGTKQFIVKIGLAAAAVGPLALIVGKASTAFGTAQKGAKLLSSGFAKIGASGTAALGVIGAIVIALVALQREFAKANANRLRLGLDAVSGAVSGLIKNQGLLSAQYDVLDIKDDNYLSNLVKQKSAINNLSVTMNKQGQIVGVYGTKLNTQIKNLEASKKALDDAVKSVDKDISAKENANKIVQKQIDIEIEYIRRKVEREKLTAREARLEVQNSQILKEQTAILNKNNEEIFTQQKIKEELIKQQNDYADGIENELGLFNQIKNGLNVIETRQKFLGDEVDVSAEKMDLFVSLLEQAASQGLPETSDAVEWLQKKLIELQNETGKAGNELSKLDKIELGFQGLDVAMDIFSNINELMANSSQMALDANQAEIEGIDLKIAKLHELDEAGRTSSEQKIANLETDLKVATKEARTTEIIKINSALKILNAEKNLEDQKAQLIRDGALLQYDADMSSYRAGLLQIQLDAAIAVMKGFAQLGPIGGAIAAVGIGAAQITNTVIAVQNKPKRPQFEKGVIDIPRDTEAFVHAGETIVPKTFTEAIKQGEMSLTGSDVNSGSSMSNVKIYIGSDLIYENLHKASRDGNLLIDAGAIVK